MILIASIWWTLIIAVSFPDGTGFEMAFPKVFDTLGACHEEAARWRALPQLAGVGLSLDCKAHEPGESFRRGA